MSHTFSAEIKKNEAYTVIFCNGEIDINTISDFQTLLLSVNKQKKTILNLSDVTFLDSAGLGIIAKHAKVFKDQGNMLQVECEENSISKLLRISNLDKDIIKLNVKKESI